jgi:hypothetical protein
MKDDKTYAPLVLFEYDHKPGHYCLMLTDNHMVDVMDVFEENGRYGNGYGWTDVAVAAIRQEAPAIEGKVDFDPEAGMFVAFGEDLDALQQLGRILSGAFADKEQLGPLVASAPYEWD